MSEPELRPARPADLPAVQAAFYESHGEMVQRLYRRAPKEPPADLEPIYPHLLATSQGGFWVAEDRGEILGFCCGILRGQSWYLSELWLRPAHHGRGLGKALLNRSLIPALREGITLQSVYASGDPAALALYQRAGMVAFFPLMHLSHSAEGVRPHLGPPREFGPLELRPLERRPAASDLRALLELDVEVRGCPRMEDHRFWLEEERRSGYLLRVRHPEEGHAVVGYAYVREDGFVGPLALRDPQLTEAAYAAVAMTAAEHAKEVSFELPGVNSEAIQFLLRKGFRLTSGPSFLSTAPVGRMDRYAISGADLF